MHIRCTEDGLLVVVFDTTEEVPDEGFVGSVGIGRLHAGILLTVAPITIGGMCIQGLHVSVLETLITVWKFDSIKALEARDKTRAMLVGGAATRQHLIDLAELGKDLILGYKDTATREWLDYIDAENLFNESPTPQVDLVAL